MLTWLFGSMPFLTSRSTMPAGGRIPTSFADSSLTLAISAAACARTAQGAVTDTKANTAAVRGAIDTLDVKTAIIADKTIDAGAIDVDTFQDKKVVVLRGSVPTDAQKTKAE